MHDQPCECCGLRLATHCDERCAYMFLCAGCFRAATETPNGGGSADNQP